jgi:FkbM family methyltransferase
MDLKQYEQMAPHAIAEGITFLTPNTQCAWRVQTLLTKEPDTIAWIRNMKPGEVLYDVGANMGQYAMLAAKQGLMVHAFEPESQNFALLVRNVAINNLSRVCIPWPVALSDWATMEVLHLSCLAVGGSCHAYGDPFNYQGVEKKFPYQQGSISQTIDFFSSRYDKPDHIKIDVDGFEHKVIAGGEETLKTVKSCLIEINTRYAEHMELVRKMTNEYGFDYDAAQALESRRKEGPFEGVGNIIFYRA